MIPVLALGVSITYSFANSQITNDGTYDYFEFDIMAYADDSGTQHGDLFIVFKYDTDGFGEEINLNGKVTVTQGTLLETSPFPYYDVYINDNAFDRLAITIEYTLPQPQYANYMPTTATQLLHVKIQIADNSYTSGLSFYTARMGDAQYYSDHETIYSPVYVGADMDETPPVELSSFTAVISAQNFVQLQWVTQSETNCAGYRIYRNTSYDLETATMLNAFIEATNTSQMQIYVYWDREVWEDGTYYYWLQNLDFDGTHAFHGPISITIALNSSGAPAIPIITGINNAFPNPFNPRTTIEVGIARAGETRIGIYNLRGQLVRVLLDDFKDRGTYLLYWDGTDANGKALPSGIYFVKMMSGGVYSHRKVILMK